MGNKYSPTVIVSAITSQLGKAKLPTHIELSAEKYHLPKDSVALLEQIRTLDKRRLREKVTTLSSEKMREVNKAILISLGVFDPILYNKKTVQTFLFEQFYWQGWKESNPPLEFWRLSFYR